MRSDLAHLQSIDPHLRMLVDGPLAWRILMYNVEQYHGRAIGCSVHLSWPFMQRWVVRTGPHFLKRAYWTISIQLRIHLTALQLRHISTCVSHIK